MVTKITHSSMTHFTKKTGKNLKVTGQKSLKVANRVKEGHSFVPSYLLGVRERSGIEIGRSGFLS